MNQRSSAPARIFAATALIVAFVIAVAVVAGGGIGGGSSDSDGRGHSSKVHEAARKRRNAPATYVVQSGDTLVAIAHRTGIPVVRIERLNPEVDPQILIAGEKLELK
jgi:LysM repeat protein